MYNLGPTQAHDKQHVYMGHGATLKSCVGFVCLKSNGWYLGNKQQLAHYPRASFANCQAKDK